MRIALKSDCKEPVTYAVAMHRDDWTNSIEFVYDRLGLHDCQTYQDPDVIECLIKLTGERPSTGWLLKDGVHGIHWAYKVESK